jgi:hypothetical protein
MVSVIPNHKIHSIRHTSSRISSTKLLLPYKLYSQNPSCWLMNRCGSTRTALLTRIHGVWHADSYISSAILALFTRFPASVMLAHESPPPVLYYPAQEIHSVCHAGSCISAARRYTALSTRFTASVTLAHDSLPPLLYYSVHEIHSICYAGSLISAAILALF